MFTYEPQAKVAIIGLCTVSLYMILRARFSSRNRNPLPPGPPAVPVIGHAHLIPSSSQDLFFYELSKIYGDVIYLRVLNKEFVILNSARAATELIDRRGGNYRNRPKLPVYEILGFGGTMAFLDDGEEYRAQRKMFQQYFGKERVRAYRGLQEREACGLALNLLNKPENFSAAFLQFSTAVIMELTYGHRITSDADPHLKIAQDCSHLLCEIGPPGASPVDFLPILQHFPSWFPGTFYTGFARKSSHRLMRLFEYPFEQVKDELIKGTARPSFLTAQLEEMTIEFVNPERVKNAAGIVYLAGAEASSSTLAFFLLAMVLYPEIQSRAQQEIDNVVGNDRLPVFNDRESLPYLECVLQETLRWNHAVPAGIPRVALEDDIYNGMLIPKGATVVSNTTGITLDELTYKNSSVFDPSRFLPAPQGRGEPYTTALFGFGTRKCPGRHLGVENIWIGIATILSTLTIKRALGPDGKEIIPEVISVAEGIASHPKKFPFVVEARTHQQLDLLVQASESS